MMSKKATVFNNIVMSLIFTTIFAFEGQYFGTGHIDWATMPISYGLGFLCGFLVVQFIPCVPLGMALARKLRLKPGGFGSYACICVVLSVILTVIMTYVMTVVGVSVLGGAPVPVGFMVATGMVGPFILEAIVVALVVSKPIQALAIKLLGGAEHAPGNPHGEQQQAE